MSTVILPPIVLASSSTWRAQLLAAVGLVAVVDPPEIDEAALVETDPVERALALARAKCELVLPQHPDALIIAADQVAHLEGRVFGKPANPKEHLEMLRGLRGKTHELVTGVAIAWQGNVRQFHDTTSILFRNDLSEAELKAYVRTGEGAACAGGYQVERLGPWLIERLEGDWFNVVGLPIPRLVSELRRMGYGLEHVAGVDPAG